VPTAAAPPAMAMPIYPSVRSSQPVCGKGKVGRHTPFDGLVDEKVKRLRLQIRWFPFQETSCDGPRLSEGKSTQKIGLSQLKLFASS
jgi:hypothetical protein